MVDSNAVRGKWSLGRITAVFPGPDGRVRNVKVKTSAGEYSRPITKVAVIHPAEGENWKDNVKDKDYALIGAEDISSKNRNDCVTVSIDLVKV